MSFVNTLKAWKIDVPNLEEIERMKSERATFSAENFDEILRYCNLELDALVKLIQRFRDNHVAAGLPTLSGLYGPGAIANGLLRRHSIKQYMLECPEINLAARHAYAAGRIERHRYGNYEGPLRIYDINSAYPYTISNLPSLAGGWRRWRRRGGNAPNIIPMSLYHVRLFNHDKYASPLFYRKGHAKSRPIYFPNPKRNDYIETWVWTPEYETLVKMGFPFECMEAYLFAGDPNTRPFRWMEDLYLQKLAYKQEGNPAEKNAKLAINSVYGKFVQQAGYGRENKIPKWHQLEWGGYITSATRATIYNAMASVRFDNVVACETDSIIVAGTETPDIRIGEGLGEWSVKEYEGITFIQSGVYWLKKDGEWHDKYSKRRGYLPGTLHRDDILRAWDHNPAGDSAIYDLQEFLTVVGKANQFITLGHCYRPGQTLDSWGDWQSGPKKLSLWKTNKRAICRTSNPKNGLLDTEDLTEFNGWSSPYTLEWEPEDEGV